MECPRCKEPIKPLFIETPDTPHYGKEVCPNCEGWLRWISKPENQSKRAPTKYTAESLEITACEFCLRSREMLGKNETLDVHHKMPIDLGGEDVETNILVLCTYCHKTAHQRHIYLYEHFKIKEMSGITPIEPPSAKPEISIPMLNKQEFPIFLQDIDEWREAYPAVDILMSLRNMRQWCISNPRKRKTERGMRRFITGWLERIQNRGGNLTKTALEQPIDDRPQIWPKKDKGRNSDTY